MKTLMMLVLLTAGTVSVASAAPSKEDREAMAKAHEKMAACLRTDTALEKCHEELMTECKGSMGEACPGMGKGMHKMRGKK